LVLSELKPECAVKFPNYTKSVRSCDVLAYHEPTRCKNVSRRTATKTSFVDKLSDTPLRIYDMLLPCERFTSSVTFPAKLDIPKFPWVVVFDDWSQRVTRTIVQDIQYILNLSELYE